MDNALLSIFYDQRVILPFAICRLVCKGWREIIDGHHEVVVVNSMEHGPLALGRYFSKLTNLKAVHFDRQFRKAHSTEISHRLSAGGDNRRVPGALTLREREEEKIQGAFRALSMCRPVEVSLAFCRLSHQDLEALLHVFAQQVVFVEAQLSKI